LLIRHTFIDASLRQLKARRVEESLSTTAGAEAAALHARRNGFDLHAGLVVRARDRAI